MTSYKKQERGVYRVHDGVKFRVWAPTADEATVNNVELVLLGADSRETCHTMTNERNGYWSTVVPSASDGQQYFYRIDGSPKSDPCAQAMVNSAGNSIVYLGDYEWKVNDFQMAAWNELVIYQMHCRSYPDKTVEKKDLLRGIIDDLWYLQKLGVNAIALLPTSEFGGDVDLGYSTSALYAVESAYGGPTALKELVDAAHARGIAVLLDVVYNHLFPDGEKSMWQFTRWHPRFWVKEEGEGYGGGIYFYQSWKAYTDWGKRNRPDYGRIEVRDFLHDNAMMWLNEYRIDGMRFDSTISIRNVYGHNNDPLDDPNNLAEGWLLMQEINNSVKQYQQQRNVITIAEDLQDNEWITKDTGGKGAGFGTQWDAGFLHASRDVVTRTWDEERDMEGIRNILYHRFETDAFKRIVMNETHDECKGSNLRLPDAIDRGNVDTSWQAKKRIGVGAALVMSAPGITQMFMGQELLEWKRFAPKREEGGVDWNRFCKIDTDCRDCMTRHGKCLTPTGTPCDKGISCSYCPELPDRCEPEGPFKGIFLLYRDLIRLRRNWFNNTRGLRGQHINVFHVNNKDKVIAYHRYENGGPGDDVVVVLNFGRFSFHKYTIGFPCGGHWQVRFNSDWNGYDSSFGNFFSYGTDAITAEMDGLHFKGDVGIAPYSAIILSQ